MRGESLLSEETKIRFLENKHLNGMPENVRERLHSHGELCGLPHFRYFEPFFPSLYAFLKSFLIFFFFPFINIDTERNAPRY